MSEILSLDALERWHGGFPGPHEFATLDTLQPSDQNPGIELAREAGRVLLEHWKGNQFGLLYMYGRPGTGKTHAAIGIARSLHDAGAEVTYMYGPALSEEYDKLRGWGCGATAFNYDTWPFPTKFYSGGDVSRNPRSVLVFDDYTPGKQGHLAAAAETAADYGGLLIVTSNETDPFALTDAHVQEPSSQELVIGRIDTNIGEALDERRAAAATMISDSLRSRIAAAVHFVEFTGPDMRPSRSIWG